VRALRVVKLSRSLSGGASPRKAAGRSGERERHEAISAAALANVGRPVSPLHAPNKQTPFISASTFEPDQKKEHFRMERRGKQILNSNFKNINKFK